MWVRNRDRSRAITRRAGGAHALGQWHFLPFSFFEPVPQLSPEAKRRHHHRLRGKEYGRTMRALAEWSWFYVPFARYNCVRGPFIPVSPRFNVFFSTLEKSLYSRWEEKKKKEKTPYVVSPLLSFQVSGKFLFLNGSIYSIRWWIVRILAFFFFDCNTFDWMLIGCWLIVTNVEWKSIFFFADKLFRYFYKK